MSKTASLTATALSLEQEAATILENAHREAEALRLQGCQANDAAAETAKERRILQARDARAIRSQALGQEIKALDQEQVETLSAIETVSPERRRQAVDKLLILLRERRHD